MSGHSKWHTTKRHKAIIDAKRGKIFSVCAKEITLAARSGGGNPESNARLRTWLLKARAANMPSDNIERAVKKGTGELPGVSYEEIVYEGFGPAGVGIVVECTTDNKTRTVAEVRACFTKAGGSMATIGALAHSFTRKGQFIINGESVTEDKLMEIALDAGAEDVLNHGDHFEVLTGIRDYDTVAKALDDKGIKPDASEIAYLPVVGAPVNDAATLEKVLNLIEALDALDDVKAVHGNHEPAEGLLG